MITITLPKINVFWVTPPQNPVIVGTAFGDKQVLVVKHDPNVKAILGIDLSVKGQTDPAVLNQINPQVAQVELIQHVTETDSNGNQVSDTTNSRKTIPFTVRPRSQGPDSPFPIFVEFDMTVLLKRLGTGINTNLIEAKVTVTGNNFSAGPITSDNHLHLAKQQVIVFLPGVAGSKIETEAFQGEDSFPAWSIGWIQGTDEFGRLLCDRTGTPPKGSEAHNTTLFEKFLALGDFPKVPVAVLGGAFNPVAAGGILTIEEIAAALAKIPVYNARDQKIFNGPDGHPKITLGNGKVFTHYNLEAWPYDWRLKLEIPKAMLLKDAMPTDGSGKPLNIGKINESLSDILARRKKDLPLLDDKLVVSGHSTGGVILRGLLSDPRSQALISRCFFIDVPFFGAPKAYFVYLKGEMLPLIRNGLLQEMAPNLPIVYYLAPTEKYDDNKFNPNPGVRLPPVALVPQASGASLATDRRVGQNVGDEIIKPMVKALGTSQYPATVAGWNDFLEQSARSYHASIIDPVIGWGNCKVFFSRHKDNNSVDTPGAAFLSPGDNSPQFLKIQGDGTVPETSLKGDSPASTWVELTAGPAHDAAANDPVVWATMIQELTRP